MTTIHDLYDLADHLGVASSDPEYRLESIEAGIRSRLFKDTACGIGFAYHAPASHTVGYREVTYVLVWEHSILGPRVVWWRKRGGRRQQSSTLPQHVCDYLLLTRLEYPTLRPEGGGSDDVSGVERAYPYDPWSLSAAGENVHILARSERRGRLYLTLRLAAPVRRMDKGSVSVAGYCEGTDAECGDHTLAFPFTAAAFDAAVEAADRDGCDLWDDTHGCGACAEHYGVPVEDGVPADECPVWKACPSCEGHGIVL
jgi:hypothetical protein